MAGAHVATHSVRSRLHVRPTILLLIVPAFIAEALSGATPPTVFFLQPNILIAFCLYYGSAAILARELSLRWRGGWPSILLLGAAFAVIQEGLGTKVFFDPSRSELSPLVNYGTLGGVHWVFVVQLVIYHSVYSIALPIALVELVCRNQRNLRWVGDRGLILAGICLAVITWLLYLIYPFQPPPGPYLGAAAAAALFVLAARTAPITLGTGRRTAVWRPRTWWLLGMVAGAVFFTISFGAPSAQVAPPVTALGLVATALVCGWLVVRHSGAGKRWSEHHQLALAAGLLSPFIVLAFVQETRGRPGSIAVGLVAAAFLLWLARRLARVPVST